MALEDLGSWARRADTAVNRLMDHIRRDGGCDHGVNEVRPRAADGVDLSALPSAQARAFFSVIDEVTWPDVWNGYFLGPAARVISDSDSDSGFGTSAVVVGSEACLALVIGSDGGGNLFAIDIQSRAVLRVLEPAFTDGEWRGVTTHLAADLNDFLERLLDNALLILDGGSPDF